MAPSQNIGPYELLRPLGMGGMAETYVALRRGPAGFEQRVCIKRVLPVYASEPRFVEMFLDEARLLAHLRNANITQVYDFGQAGGSYYLAMELVEGCDLDGLLRGLLAAGRRFPPETLCFVLAQLLSALSYAHTLSVAEKPLALVHRDISPSNVLVSSHGEVKLTDFGIAKSSQRAHRTKTGHTRGKLAYMSPEQLRGEDIDGRSDLFAVGVVAYELLSGQHPFDTETDLGLIQNIVSGTRTPLLELVPDCSPRLLSLIDDLLQTDRDLRPATADQALSILPYEQAPHRAQRALAELVREYGVSRSANAAWPAASSASDTELRTRGTPPASPSRTDAVGRLPVPARARSRTWLALGLATALSGVVAAALLTRSDGAPELPAPPGAAALPPEPAEVHEDMAAQPNIDEAAPSPRVDEPTPAGALPTRVEPGPIVGELASPSEPSSAVVARPGTKEKRDGKRRASRAEPSAGEPSSAASAASAEPAAQKEDPPPASPSKRGRSGLSVRPDDF